MRCPSMECATEKLDDDDDDGVVPHFFEEEVELQGEREIIRDDNNAMRAS